MSQYAKDADFIVENLQKDKKSQFWDAKPDTEVNTAPVKNKSIWGKIPAVFAKNYTLFILVILLFIAIIKLDGYVADFVIVLSCAGIFYFIGARFFQLRKK